MDFYTISNHPNLENSQDKLQIIQMTRKNLKVLKIFLTNLKTINKNRETYDILRGGAFNQSAQNVRSSSRLSSPQNYRATFNGLRLVKTIVP